MRPPAPALPLQPAQPCLVAHATAAFRLHVERLELFALADARSPDGHATAVQLRPRPDVGRERPHPVHRLLGSREVELTTQEFNLLYVLLSRPGIVFSRDALLSRTWKESTFVTVRSVDTLVKRLRKKIEEDPANPAVILTVWGSGYKAADV